MKLQLKVLFEDNHLLVLDKPAPLPTMGVKESENSLLKMARQYIKRKYDKPGNVYLGVVSRIDSFVTGVVVFARTSKAAARLTTQFGQGEPLKQYLAIVPANRCQIHSELQHYLVKDEANHRMMTVDETTAGAKHARLVYERIGQFERDCLIKIGLLTGRKHQIRVQLSASGLPIVGDRKYGSQRIFPRGIALHSHSLTISHPVLREEMTFRTDPPKYWAIERFRQNHQ